MKNILCKLGFHSYKDIYNEGEYEHTVNIWYTIKRCEICGKMKHKTN